MQRNHRALIAGLLLGAQVATACTSWRVQSVTPQELIAREHPKAIQVREPGGAVYVVESPQVAGDSLTGFVTASRHSAAYQAGAALGSLARRSIALMTVDRVAVRQFEFFPTFALVGVVGVLGSFAGLAIVMSDRGQ